MPVPLVTCQHTDFPPPMNGYGCMHNIRQHTTIPSTNCLATTHYLHTDECPKGGGGKSIQPCLLLLYRVCAGSGSWSTTDCTIVTWG